MFRNALKRMNGAAYIQCNRTFHLHQKAFNSLQIQSQQSFEGDRFNFAHLEKLLALSVTGVLSWLGLAEEEKVPELVVMMKRGEYLIRQQEFDKAEQVFHVALKTAQDIQDELSVNYIYSKLGEIAVLTKKYKKALRIYKELLQRLLDIGKPEDDLGVLNISYKIARIFLTQKDYSNANTGFNFVYDRLKPKIDKALEEKDMNIISLWMLVLDSKGTLAFDQGDLDTAYKYTKNTYELASQHLGEDNEDTLMILNDLALLHLQKLEYESAFKCADKALKLAKKLPDMFYMSLLYVTLGRIYIKQRLLTEAKQSCEYGLRHANTRDYTDGISAASECITVIEELMQRKK